MPPLECLLGLAIIPNSIALHDPTLATPSLRACERGDRNPTVQRISRPMHDLSLATLGSESDASGEIPHQSVVCARDPTDHSRLSSPARSDCCTPTLLLHNICTSSLMSLAPLIALDCHRSVPVPSPRDIQGRHGTRRILSDLPGQPEHHREYGPLLFLSTSIQCCFCESIEVTIDYDLVPMVLTSTRYTESGSFGPSAEESPCIRRVSSSPSWVSWWWYDLVFGR